MNLNEFRTAYNNEKTNMLNINEMTGDYSEIAGRLPINSAGEAVADVPFPVRFVTQPIFRFGFELQEGEGVISGRLPSGSAVVQSWNTIERLPSTVHYVGARLIIVTQGLKYQKMILNYSFSGRTLTNPF